MIVRLSKGQISGLSPTHLPTGQIAKGLIGTLRLIERNGAELMHDGPGWSLLKLNPQKQRGYVDLLKEHLPGVEAYYPRYSRMIRPHGARRPKRVERPVYPGYLFIMVGNGDMHGPVSLPVSARWVKFGGKVESVPGFVVEQLRKLERANELVREVKYVDPYVPGARVRVHLPVQDIHAVIVKLVGGNRVLVDTNLCRVTVPRHRIQIL
jgi:hypothetical protein